MKYLFILPLYFFSVFCFCGCESTPAGSPSNQHSASIEGLTLADLKESRSQTLEPERLLTFRILTYEIGAEGLDQFRTVMDTLSQKQLRHLQKNAFVKNGFAVGTGLPSQGSSVAQRLFQIGAVRRAIKKLSIPPESTEIFAAVTVQPGVPVEYSTNAGVTQTFVPTMGLGGWTLNAKRDPRFRGMVQVSLAPAFWQRGGEDLRLRLGQEPLKYHFIEEGRFIVRLEERGFLVLGPDRMMPLENSLDKVMFFVPEKKAKLRFFVIICDDTGD